MNLAKNGFTLGILIMLTIIISMSFLSVNPSGENVVENQKLLPQKSNLNQENTVGPTGQAPALFIEPKTTKNDELGSFFGEIIKKSEVISVMQNTVPVIVPTPKPTPTPVLVQNKPQNIFIANISEYELELAKEQVGELVNVGLRLPVSKDGIKELLKLLEGFGDYFNLPYEVLHDPNSEFALSDINIVKKTIEVYHNPVNVILGEECGLEGPTFTYPPGWNDITAACGGTPGFGGTSCNTDSECYYTGFCFTHSYSYISGSWDYCWTPSCYGICGNSTYIWDSVTKTCGCGT